MDDILLFVAIGFLAQMIDGAIGMAYGLTATSVLLSFGTPAAVASASVHAAEIFTTGASGLSHWRFGNVDRRLVLRLAVPGAVGGMLGALTASLMPADIIAPAVNLYLLLMGFLILWRALRRGRPAPVSEAPVGLLGLGGGFLDAIGGGGWGPLVASTMIGRGDVPRIAIGSTNAAEFFVTCAIAVTFVASIGLELWEAIVGLVIGGIIAAPLAALITRRLPDRILMGMVGALVMLLSLRSLALRLGIV